MTERFICDDAGSLIDMEERKYYDIVEEVCPLLNALHEENQELKSKYSEQCIQLDFLKDENQHMRKVINENEQLKKELKVYHKVASCSNCKYHNYDWFDDGDEFEVCDKGNDVTEGICEEWEDLE